MLFRSPLGVFGVAFSTILLPHFTRTKLENPDKMSFYIFESLKLVLWVTIPATLVLMFLSEDIFITFFVSKTSKFPVERVSEAAGVLVAFLVGLCFFSLNKLLFSVYYALHDMVRPMIISIVGTLLNIAANWYFLSFGGVGIAYATTISGVAQTLLCFYFLHRSHALSFSFSQLLKFCCIFMAHVAVTASIFWLLFSLVIRGLSFVSWGHFFVQEFGFWLWLCPLMALFYGVLYYARRWFTLQIYFLD